MPRPQFSSSDLNRLREQLNAWRRRRGSRRRLPAEAWDAAATLARAHGVSQVARTLRLNFYKLRQRGKKPRPSEQREPPASGFVEIAGAPQPTLAEPSCRIEWTDATGARMTLEMPRDPPTLVALVETFWRRGR